MDLGARFGADLFDHDVRGQVNEPEPLRAGVEDAEVDGPTRRTLLALPESECVDPGLQLTRVDERAQDVVA